MLSTIVNINIHHARQYKQYNIDDKAEACKGTHNHDKQTPMPYLCQLTTVLSCIVPLIL